MEVPVRESFLWRILPARYILSVLGSIGFAIVYGLKVNLSVAMVGMLNHTALKKAQAGAGTPGAAGPEECTAPGGASNATEQDGPFTWSSEVQGIVLSCYFWGYLVSQLPAARIAELYSAKWVMFFSVFINVVCTLLTPVMCNLHYIGVVLMRIGEGIGGGVTFPAMHTMLSKWAPPSERSFMAALTYAGTSLGTVISMLMAGVLTVHFGWESVFYVMGGLSLIWCVLWVVMVQDTPQQQRFMNNAERTMILQALGNQENQGPKPKIPMPWGKVFKSPPFLSILVAHTCSNFGWYMVLIELPFYMKQVLKFNMTENALAVSMPFLSLWFFSMTLSRTLDWLREKKYITTSTARKIATGFASLVPAICLLAICYIGCNRSAAVIIMATAVTSIGGMFCGFLSNHIDIAPNFAGTLMALTNTVATIPGIVVPIFVGYVTHGDQTITAWRKIFFTTIGLYAVELVTYTVFGSGEEQPWNKVETGAQETETKPLRK
ncbi:sialin [Spodoptera frugiperda]|uniref:Sialin n=1 Tax=Spodoptera frugiperda TaxID=7108 RepID=A0A9R0D8F1_SPOFR|nr:sialin [Spodoptera frugiperda]